MHRHRTWNMSTRNARTQRNRLASLANSNTLGQGLFGSNAAGVFVRDAIAGQDSVDIVTIGDSNAGFSYNGYGGGGGGFTRGLLRALNNAGAGTYSTPLMPIMSQGSTNAIGVVMEDNGSTITTIAGIFSNVSAPADYGGTINVVSGAASGPAAVTAQAIPATAFKPYGLTNFNYAWLPSSTQNTFSQLNSTYPGGTSPPGPAVPSWMTPGTALKYRVTHTQSIGGVSIKPTVYKVVNTTYTSLATSEFSTLSGTTKIVSNDVSFTMPSESPAAAIVFGWAYINAATGAAGAIFDCLYKAAKGVAVNNLHYGSGETISTISSVVSGANAGGKTFLENYFKQIVARQQAAGGSGRVMVWINGGINGDTVSGWQTGMTSMIQAIQQAWANALQPPENLAFAVSASHPLDTDYGGTTEATLRSIRSAAKTWVRTMQNTVLVDLPSYYTAAQMTTNGYYAGPGSGVPNSEAHLSQSGYYEFGKKIINALKQSR